MRFADPANHETTGCASYPHKIAMSQKTATKSVEYQTLLWQPGFSKRIDPLRPVTAKLCNLATWKSTSNSRSRRFPKVNQRYFSPKRILSKVRAPGLREMRASPDTSGAGRTGDMSKVAPVLARICNGQLPPSPNAGMRHLRTVARAAHAGRRAADLIGTRTAAGFRESLQCVDLCLTQCAHKPMIASASQII